MRSATSVASVFLVLRYAVSEPPFVANNSGPFTNGGCKYRTFLGKDEFFCEGPIHFPDTFDVLSIRPSVDAVTLENGVVNPGFIPLPSLPNLRRVQITNFNQENSSIRFPLNEFLRENRHRIERLELRNVRMDYITSEDFYGFNQLKALECRFLGLKEVPLNLFAQLSDTTEQPGGGWASLQDLDWNVYPQLTFDWAILRPIAANLTTVTLRGAIQELKMTTTSESGSFDLPRLRKVNFLGNRMTHIPNSVLRTLPDRVEIRLTSNMFCETSDRCDCCEAQLLSLWARNRKAKVRDFQCGGREFDMLPGNLFMGNCSEDTLTDFPSTRPNPNCYYSLGVGRVKTLKCDPRLRIPEDFSMGKILNDTQRLILVDGTIASDGQNIALPKLPGLRTVELTDFKTTDGLRFPFRQMLEHNMDHLMDITFSGIPMNYLDRSDLAGFKALDYFMCYNCQLRFLSPDLFVDMAPGQTPVLWALILENNPGLGRFEWDLLRPVAESIQRLNIRNCGLGAITLNGTNFSTPNFTDLLLGQNTALKTIPQFVFDSFSRQSMVEGVEFCRESTRCDCCDAAPVVNYAYHHNSYLYYFECANDTYDYDYKPPNPIENCGPVEFNQTTIIPNFVTTNATEISSAGSGAPQQQPTTARPNTASGVKSSILFGLSTAIAVLIPIVKKA